MPITTWKKIKRGNDVYMVHRSEFPDRIVYEAFEMAKKINGQGKPGFISFQTHAHTIKIEGQLWGDIATRAITQEMMTLTPRSPERREAEDTFHSNNCLLACNVINDAFRLEPGATADNGSYVVRREKPVVIKEEPKGEVYARSVIEEPDTGDEIKDMLSVMDFNKLKKFAEANGVPVKPTDNSGLLKMRVGNALRQKQKKGETIVKV